MTKKFLPVVALALMSAQAIAEKVVISSGVQGGTYDSVYAANLAKVLKSKGFEVEIIQSNGSMENLDRLKSGEATIGFSQLDAYAKFLTMPGNSPLETLAPLAKECVYMVTRKDSKVSSEKDLRKGEFTLAIGNEGSGSAVTWQYITTLVPDYKKTRILYTGGTRALNQLGSMGGPDAYMFVTVPGNPNHKLIQAVTANKELHFLEVDKGGLDGKLPGGKPVYSFEDIKVCDGWGCTVETICTGSYMFASGNASDRAIQAISDVMAMSPKTITESAK